MSPDSHMETEAELSKVQTLLINRAAKSSDQPQHIFA